MKTDAKTMGRGKYKGLTKRRYKREYAKSEPGSNKGETCQATGLDKAMAKYTRSIKTHTTEYIGHNLKKDKAAGRRDTYFTRNCT